MAVTGFRPEQVARLAAMHGQLNAQFDSLNEAWTQFRELDGALATLQQKGDAVGHRDLMNAAAQLYADGHVDARSIVAAIGTAPIQGPALAEWVRTQRQNMMTQMARNAQAQEQVRQHLGRTSLLLTMHHLVSGAGVTSEVEAGGQTPGAPPNAP